MSGTSLVADANRLAALSATRRSLDVSLPAGGAGVPARRHPADAGRAPRQPAGSTRRVVARSPRAGHGGRRPGGGGTLFLKGVESSSPCRSARARADRRCDRSAPRAVAAGVVRGDAAPIEDRRGGRRRLTGRRRDAALWVRLLVRTAVPVTSSSGCRPAGAPFGVPFTGDARRVNVLIFVGTVGRHRRRVGQLARPADRRRRRRAPGHRYRRDAPRAGLAAWLGHRRRRPDGGAVRHAPRSGDRHRRGLRRRAPGVPRGSLAHRRQHGLPGPGYRRRPSCGPTAP